MYRLADYLDQHGRRHRHALIPPPSFWTAARCAQPADLTTLAAAARARGLYRDAAQLLKNAAARGNPRAGANLIDVLHDLHPGDHRPAQWVTADVALAALDDPDGVARLLGWLREAGAQDQVAALADRLPGEGLFDLFGPQGNHQALYQFGRNPDGSPAEPWGWEDLDGRGPRLVIRDPGRCP